MHSTRSLLRALQVVGLCLALDGGNTLTDPSTSGRKFNKFICNESFFAVWLEYII